MDITPLISSDRQVIQSYGEGRFRVSGKVYERPIIVYPDKVADWPVQGRERLSSDDFIPVFNEEIIPEIILFGCGGHMVFYPPSFRSALKKRGAIIDVMDTGAACRTYNVLMAEGRRVAAALLPVKD